MFARLHLRRSTITALLVALAMIATMSTAFAKNGPPPGKGHGGGETTVANNLSVPAVFVPSAGFNLTDPMLVPPPTLAAPTNQVGYFTPGTDENGVQLGPAGYYYIQGVAKWQAEYQVSQSDTATAKWGDNLTGTAKLQVGHPVRVEMGLTSATTLQGFKVIKLQPDLPDRESKYGTLAIATLDADGNPTSFAPDPTWQYAMPARVWGAGATLTIDGGTPIAMPGEINATGAVVFGYNWKPTSAGEHTLTFNPPSGVTVSDTASLTIKVNVVAGGSGGGGRP